MITRAIFLLLLIPAILSADEWNYTGIPYVTDNVPDEIMPTIPDGADLASTWKWDPCAVATPAWTNSSNQYWVDPSHGRASDSNNGGHGSPSAPRATIPGLTSRSWSLSPGDQVFIVGDGNVYGNGWAVRNWNMDGTSAKPIWIIGKGTTKPRLNFGSTFLEDIHWVMFHNLHWGGSSRFQSRLQGDSHNICYRYCLFNGVPGYQSDGAKLLRINGTNGDRVEWIVIYQCVFNDFGAWKPGSKAVDRLGIHVREWTRWLWIIENQIYHMQGDSVMTGDSNFWNYNRARRSHYTYIGGNEFYENFENGYDCKNSYHNIVSGNYFHDFYASRGEPSSNRIACIFGQDKEGYVSGYTWIINNEFEDCGIGAVTEADADDSHGYLIGNLFVNCPTGLRINARDSDYGQTEAEYVEVLNNTFIGCSTIAIQNFMGSSGVTIKVEGNIISGGSGPYDVWLQDHGNTKTYKNNIVYRSGGGGNVRLDGTTSTSNNSIGISPGLDGNYRPGAASYATDYQNAAGGAYATFQRMYGISIAEDYDGVTRPQDGEWDAGAFEY